ncbi:MAG: FAD-binding oxidoreductase, partial [Clostridium sp.]
KKDFSYDESRRSWNRAIEKYPLVIVYCECEIDICNAMLFARENSLEVRIRSGCHHYEGYSSGDDVVIIDVSKMNNIYIDEDNGIVKIQGGVRNREIYEDLALKGYIFPGGGCPTVGVIALILGGGWGYSSRLLGLGCDSLLKVEIIDYKGQKIVANENTNEDLFWACRGGGGGNFGIVTEMTLKIKEKIKMATLINLDYKNIDAIECVNIFEMFQNEFKDLDRRINFKMGIYNSEKNGIGIKFTGLFYGSEVEVNKILKPFKNVCSKINIKVQYITVLEANQIIQDSHPDYEKYKSTGRFVGRDYSRTEMDMLVNLVRKRPNGAVYSAISLYGLGGAVSEKSSESTAFYYRDAKFIMGLQSVWEDEKYASENIKWIEEKFSFI